MDVDDPEKGSVSSDEVKKIGGDDDDETKSSSGISSAGIVNAGMDKED